MKASGIDTPIHHASTDRVLRDQVADQGPKPYTRGHPPETQKAHGFTRSANFPGTTPTPNASFVRTDSERGPLYEARHALMNKTRQLFGQPQRPAAPLRSAQYAQQANRAQQGQQVGDFVVAMQHAYPEVGFQLAVSFGSASFYAQQNPELLEQVSRL